MPLVAGDPTPKARFSEGTPAAARHLAEDLRQSRRAGTGRSRSPKAECGDRLDLGTDAREGSDFDIASGQGSSDTFVFNIGSGYLTVADFVQGEDQLEISGFTFSQIATSFDAGRNSTWVWETNTLDVLAELQGFSGILVDTDF